MDRLSFVNYKDFVKHTLENLGDLEQSDCKDCEISFIAKYDAVCEIIREALGQDIDIAQIEIECPGYSNYEDEYIITIDNGNRLWCEPMKRESGYLYDFYPITYLLDDCSSACIPHIDSDEIFEVHVGDEFDLDEDETDELDTKVNELYIVNGKRVDKETYEKYEKSLDSDIEKKIQDARDVLREMDYFRALFGW